MTQTVEPSFIHRNGPTCDLIFWGEAPGREEAKAGRAFVGPSRQMILDPWIEEEFPDLSICLDNVVPEILDGGKGKPNKKLYDRYADYRSKRIAQLKPRAMVLLGEHATKAFGFKGRPFANCGKNFDYQGIPVIGGIHPACFLYSGGENIHMLGRVVDSVRAVLKTEHREKIKCITLRGKLMNWLDTRRTTLCALDLETSSLDEQTGCILTCAISDGRETIWVPLFHKENWVGATVGQGPRMLQIISQWWPLGPRIVHNAEFELRWMRHFGAKDPKTVIDTMLMMQLVNENEPKGLDHGVVKYLEVKPYWTRLPADGSYADVPLKELGEYNALDALYTYRLKEYLEPLLGGANQYNIAECVIHPMRTLLSTIQNTGVHVDVPKLTVLVEKTQRKAKRLESVVKKTFPDVNFKSPNQVRKLCFSTLRLRPTKRTKTGEPSVDKEVIAALAEREPRLKCIAEAKSTRGLLDRVLLPWLNLQRDGVIHTTFRFNNTWRLASSKPNMQNMDREEEDRVRLVTKGEHRSVLVSRFPNGKIIKADYSQHELRCYAAIAGDGIFLREFARGHVADPHQRTCDSLREMGVDTDRPTSKNVNFAVIYVVTAPTLEARYHVPVEIGKQIIASMHKLHPELKAHWKAVLSEAKELGYYECIFGLRRHLSAENRREERQLINFSVQCPAVVFSYIAMLSLAKSLGNMRTRIVMQTHDSIALDSPKSEVKRASKLLEQSMLSDEYLRYTGNRLTHPVPLAIDLKVGEHL